VDHAGSLGQVERLDAIGATIRISGWAFHPQHPATPVAVSVFRDGALLSRHPSGVARPDINRVYGAAGDAGFELALPAEPGRHTYTVYAASPVAGVPDSLIGGRTLTVDAADLPAAGALR
jgi:hypothetical protein